MDEHFRRIVQHSLGSTPEEMLETCLRSCIELAGATGGSILGEEGPYLRFLFSDVANLIGVNVPLDSIAGTTVTRGRVIYTYAPSDSRHFTGVDAKLSRQTRYLLSIPIPSVLTSAAEGRRPRNSGALQLLFDENVAPDIPPQQLPREFELSAFRGEPLCETHLREVIALLPIVAFAMEVMVLRQTAHQTVHELKNKLIAGLSWVDCLKTDISEKAPTLMGDAGVAEDFELAESSVREGAELAKRYLELTRIYAPAFAAVAINDVVAETARSAKALASEMGAAGLEVNVCLTPADTTRQVDAAQLKMAFFNLCKNAVEAMLERGVARPALALTTTVSGDRVLVEIADNGPGMRPEIADKLFVAFKSRKPGGAGLGLVITKKIVDVHGGAIRCRTGPEGTRFQIEV